MVVHKDRPPLTILILVLEISLRRPTLAKSLKSQSNQNGGAQGLISTHHISLGYEDLPKCEVDFSFKSIRFSMFVLQKKVNTFTHSIPKSSIKENTTIKKESIPKIQLPLFRVMLCNFFSISFNKIGLRVWILKKKRKKKL